MKKKKILFIVIAIIACAAVAAVVWNPFAAPKIDETEEEEEVLAPAGPAFNADSAYAFEKGMNAAPNGLSRSSNRMVAK